MPQFQYRNIADLQAFNLAFDVVRRHSLDCEAVLIAANHTMLSNATSDSAPAFGVAVAQSVMRLFEESVAQLEPAALRLLGESRGG
ncbi:hypothetical protein [Rhodoferax sp.]|uniref:hypothetical protein n=1 Tax=Rhodoferax sp. TaxID=50421 RepID=UPI00374D1A8B